MGGPILDRDRVCKKVTFGLRLEWQEGASYTDTVGGREERIPGRETGHAKALRLDQAWWV